MQPRIGIIMGSDSDLPVMRGAAEILDQLAVTYEMEIVSAHRTPDKLYDYARAAEARGLRVIIAGAGGAAHLPGMVASLSVLPVIGVPVAATKLAGEDALLSIVQMPAGIPVATVAIDNAVNAGILAAQMLATGDEALRSDCGITRTPCATRCSPSASTRPESGPRTCRPGPCSGTEASVLGQAPAGDNGAGTQLERRQHGQDQRHARIQWRKRQQQHVAHGTGEGRGHVDVASEQHRIAPQERIAQEPAEARRHHPHHHRDNRRGTALQRLGAAEDAEQGEAQGIGPQQQCAAA
jgi:5-(carboxyamino)imidazole ribonucleotide mutase